jgi:integrase
MPRNAQINFYLKPVDEEGKCLIYLNFKYNGKRLYFTFGERIKRADWNDRKQRPKQKSFTTSDRSHSLYDLLDNLQDVCEKAYIHEKAKGIPTPSTLKKHLQEFLNYNEVDEKASTEKKTLFGLIERFTTGEIQNKGKDKSKNTLSNYKTTKQHLEAYQAKEKIELSFEDIDLDFFYSYVSFLKKLKGRNGERLAHNTIAMDIKNIKVFMNEAVDLKYTKNLEFKHKKFSMNEVETDAVYLTEKEIIHLYKYDFSQNKRLEQVKDLFVFGCLVGLRFSDYSSVEKENIVNIDEDLFIKVIPEKTGDLVIIPCHPIVLEILKKYKDNYNSLPRALSNQNFNLYIKEVCHEAGLTEKGRLSTSPKKELYECITSHTARRSFATNLYLDGYPTIEIMKITGHKTEKAFMKYIKVSKQDAAKRLSQYMKKRWEEKRLKANETMLRVA